MKPGNGLASLFASVVLFVGMMRPLAAEPTSTLVAERPYFTMFAASIDKLLAACRVVFDAVDRPDLSGSLGDRMKTYRDFSGIDKSRPIGIMSTWDENLPANIVFLPVSQIDDLLKTATFGIVGYHEVSPGQYEIERPGLPYHVLVKKDYAFFAESIATVRGIGVTPGQLTQGLRERYDFVISFDFMQIPRSTKERIVADMRRDIEPWLQPQDDEVSESANLRRSLGKMTLGLVERAVLDAKSLTAGLRLDSESGHLTLEVIADAVPKSNLATTFNRLQSHRSEFSSLLQPDVPAGLAINLPVGALVDQILGTSGDTTTKGSQLEAGLQLAGARIGDLTLVTALHGTQAGRINDAIPQLVLKLEKTGALVSIRENVDFHRGVVLHSMTPREIPAWISDWVGPDIEIVIGQGKQTVWMGIGSPSTLVDRIIDAIDRVAEAPLTREIGPLVHGRFQASKLPEILTSTPLIPDQDLSATREILSRGDDGFSLTIEPVKDGLKLRLDAEEGLIRLLGKDWVKQIDAAITE